MKLKPLSAVDYLVVHCSATPAHMDVTAKDIKRWHRKRGFLDIGYHYVIRRDGTLEFGRDESEPGAHVRGFNHRSLGICMIGGSTGGKRPKPEDNFEETQFNALAKLLGYLSRKYPDAEIKGHGEMPRVAKACPSFDVELFKDEYGATIYE